MAAIAGRDTLRIVYRLPIAAVLFYWTSMKVVQQLTCLTLGRPDGRAYSTGELLNTPQKIFAAVIPRVGLLCARENEKSRFSTMSRFISETIRDSTKA